MGNYLAMRISGGHLEYEAVITKYPQFKSEIDEILTEKTNSQIKPEQ